MCIWVPQDENLAVFLYICGDKTVKIMALDHEDRVKKEGLLSSQWRAKSDTFDRKKNNLEIIGRLRDEIEKYPDMRFEQLLICLLGELDFNREPNNTLMKIEQSMKEYKRL